MGREEKFIRVRSTAELDHSGCYYEGDTPSVEHSVEIVEVLDEETLLKELLDKADDWQLEQMGLVRKTKMDKAQKLTLEAKYALIKFNHTHTFRMFQEVDIHDKFLAYKFDDYDLKDHYELYQRVRITDLKKISPEAYKSYQEAKKRVDAAKKRKAETAKKSKATKKKKELERAQRLIDEHNRMM